jgi:hypothetical protein
VGRGRGGRPWPGPHHARDVLVRVAVHPRVDESAVHWGPDRGRTVSRRCDCPRIVGTVVNDEPCELLFPSHFSFLFSSSLLPLCAMGDIVKVSCFCALRNFLLNAVGGMVATRLDGATV